MNKSLAQIAYEAYFSTLDNMGPAGYKAVPYDSQEESTKQIWRAVAAAVEREVLCHT